MGKGRHCLFQNVTVLNGIIYAACKHSLSFVQKVPLLALRSYPPFGLCDPKSFKQETET